MTIRLGHIAPDVLISVNSPTWKLAALHLCSAAQGVRDNDAQQGEGR
jgi:hypothetical protein